MTAVDSFQLDPHVVSCLGMPFFLTSLCWPHGFTHSCELPLCSLSWWLIGQLMSSAHISMNAGLCLSFFAHLTTSFQWVKYVHRLLPYLYYPWWRNTFSFCLVILELDPFLFHSNMMLLLSSCHVMICITGCPWVFMKYLCHSTCGKPSSTPISFDF